MRKKRLKVAKLKVSMVPVVQHIPDDLAQSVGKTVGRFAILEQLQLRILVALLGISIKQGRLVLRLNRPGVFVRAVKPLVKFLRIHVRTRWSTLEKALEKADSARNALAHSLFMRPKGRTRISIQLTNATWDTLGSEYEPVSRALLPQAKRVTKAFLRQQHASVEKALRLAAGLERRVKAAIQTLNERRRTVPALDRRTRQT